MAPRVKKGLKDLANVVVDDNAVHQERERIRKPLRPELAQLLKKYIPSSDEIDALQKQLDDIKDEQKKISESFHLGMKQLELAIAQKRKEIHEAFDAQEVRMVRQSLSPDRLKEFDKNFAIEKVKAIREVTASVNKEWFPILNACKLAFNTLSQQYNNTYAMLSDARKEVIVLGN